MGLRDSGAVGGVHEEHPGSDDVAERGPRLAERLLDDLQ